MVARLQRRHKPGSRTGAATNVHASDGSAAEQAQAKAQEIAGQAQEKVQQAADQARQQAQQVTGQARDKLREQVDQRSTHAGRRPGRGPADDLRSVAEGLREQGKDKPAKLAEQAADRSEQAATYLRDADADRILRDAEDLARRKPMAVIAGGIALGFAASRFLKASSADRYGQSAARPSTPAPLYDSVKGAVGGATDSVSDATPSADDVKQTAQEAAQEHGEQLAQSAQENAQQVREQSPMS